jgi:hypothetical protein
MAAPTPTNLNFNDANPAPPAGRQNVKWLASGSYGIAVNINGVVETLPFRDLSGNVPIAGAPGGSSIKVYKVSVSHTGPGNFTVAHGLPAAPAFVVIEMSSAGAISVQTPESDATNLYLTAWGVGTAAGTAMCFMSLPDAVLPLTPSATGNFSVAHGLVGTPQYAVVQMSSAGTIWFQATPTDATNVNLVASDAGVTGTAYVWLAIPTLTIVSTNLTVALAPSAPGNFTVAHTLGSVPSLVLFRMKSTGAIWFQSPTGYDSSNLYLVASGGGITGDAELWV